MQLNANERKPFFCTQWKGTDGVTVLLWNLSSDNLYSRSASLAKLFSGSSMEGLFCFIFCYYSLFWKSFSFIFYHETWGNGMVISPSCKTSEEAWWPVLRRDSWKTALHIAGYDFPTTHLPRHQSLKSKPTRAKKGRCQAENHSSVWNVVPSLIMPATQIMGKKEVLFKLFFSQFCILYF